MTTKSLRRADCVVSAVSASTMIADLNRGGKVRRHKEAVEVLPQSCRLPFQTPRNKLLDFFEEVGDLLARILGVVNRDLGAFFGPLCDIFPRIRGGVAGEPERLLGAIGCLDD